MTVLWLSKIYVKINLIRQYTAVAGAHARVRTLRLAHPNIRCKYSPITASTVDLLIRIPVD
jgi:hypothetical protein